MIYMNGMMTCVDTTSVNYTTTDAQNDRLEYIWRNDYEFGTDECSADQKSPELLVQDHVYIANGTLMEFQELTDYAVENCCLTGNTEVRGYVDNWQEQIEIIEDQIGVYSANITAQIATIVGQLKYLQSLLSSV